MAQAARLNLRMQRELKLLLSDPPPGATFPSLSPSSAAPSLSSIDAEIEGPDGTVYANGVFKLKIQIPERYPFQPPVVTFLTPIYHPNIDNGGRICLDILNLPPKGAWQPSLNISTVITSIGLLLSEPNPDDGLMHDASKEYKYNTQTFYQKARSMTEKFAMGQTSEDAASVSHQEIQTRTNPHKDQLQVDDKGPDASNSNSIQCFLSQNRLWGVSRKLSLDSSGLKQPKVSTEGVEAGELLHYKDSTKELNETAANYLFGNHTEAGVSNQTRDTAKEVNETPVHYPSTNNIEARGLKHKRDVLSEVNALSANYLQVNQNEADCVHKEAVGLPGECKKLWGTKNMPISVVRNSDKKDDLMPVQGASHLGAQSSSIYPLTRDSRNAEIHANLSCMEFERSSMDISLKRKQSLQYHDLKQKSGKQLHTISHPSGHPHPQTTNHRHMDTVDRNLNKVTTTDHKKLGLSGRKMPLGQSSSSHSLQDNKENLVSSSSFANSKANMHSEPSASDAHVGKSSAKVVDNKLGGNLPRRPLQSVVHLQGSNGNHFQFDQKQPDQDNEQNLETNIKVKEIEPPTPDTVIVLDSEDSEDERNLPVRSKFSIARKCLPRKQKAKA